MDISIATRALINSGFYVRGVNSTTNALVIEDPSCIWRSFETFLEYAWVIVSLIAAILLFGWAISKIRGANTDIVTNIRNLLIMFGVLSATMPIVNVIYGDNLMEKSCATIEIPLNDIQEILDARNSRLSPDENLFEAIDILDTGVQIEETPEIELTPINIPNVEYVEDPNTGEMVPTYTESAPQTEQVQAQTQEQQLSHQNQTLSEPTSLSSTTIQSNSIAPTSARTISARTIEYTRADNSRYRHNDGTVAWRQNNPGNIINSTFATNHGAIGNGRKFAIFPSESVGKQAIIRLLRTPSYNNLSIANAIKRYAPAADRNNPVQYAQSLSRRTGLDVNRTINSLSETEMQKVADAIQRIEGWQPGTVTQV